MLPPAGAAPNRAHALPGLSKRSTLWRPRENPSREKKYRSTRSASDPSAPAWIPAGLGRCHHADWAAAVRHEPAAVGRQGVPCETSIGCRARSGRCDGPGRRAFGTRAGSKWLPARWRWHRLALQYVAPRENDRWLLRNDAGGGARNL